ncbi:MAG: hypothetical protein NFCOHLIN_02075 [Gammaproteobacteria bacterium]|nr:hypothetical protein [Gammaproteobacteria bacterium]
MMAQMLTIGTRAPGTDFRHSIAVSAWFLAAWFLAAWFLAAWARTAELTGAGVINAYDIIGTKPVCRGLNFGPGGSPSECSSSHRTCTAHCS